LKSVGEGEKLPFADLMLASNEEMMRQAQQIVEASGGNELRLARVFLGGPGRAGKTSVQNALVGRSFDPGEDSTVGVN